MDAEIEPEPSNEAETTAETKKGWRCELCQKGFKSLGGYRYHVKMVCIPGANEDDEVQPVEASEDASKKRKYTKRQRNGVQDNSTSLREVPDAQISKSKRPVDPKVFQFYNTYRKKALKCPLNKRVETAFWELPRWPDGTSVGIPRCLTEGWLGSTATSLMQWKSQQIDLGGAIPNTAIVAEDETKGKVTIVLPLEGEAIRGNEYCGESMSGVFGLEYLLNAGGPVNDVAFAPTLSTEIYPFGEMIRTNYLAVALSQPNWSTDDANSVSQSTGIGSEAPFRLSARTTHDNWLQIWKVIHSQADSISSSASLHCVVDLPGRGQLVQLAWCPHLLGTSCRWDQGCLASCEVLGVLALVCGDGNCLILSLPRDTVSNSGSGLGSNSSSSSSSSSSSNDTVPFLKEEFYLVDTVVPYVNSKSTASIDNAILCISWSDYWPGHLACGMRDGTVDIWDIGAGCSIEQLSASSPTRKAKLVARISNCFVDQHSPTLSALRSVQFCPYHPELLLVGGMEGAIAIWNIRDPYRPVFTRRPLQLGWITDVAWDATGAGVVMTGAESPSVFWDPLWTVGLIAKRASLYSHVARFCGLWRVKSIPFHNQSVTISASSDGTVRCGFTTIAGVARAENTVKPGTLEIFRMHEVDPSPEMTVPGWTGQVGKVSFSCEKVIPSAEENGSGPLTISPRVAIRALSWTTVSGQRRERLSTDDTADPEPVLLAYGGTAGVIRLQWKDFRDGVLFQL